MKLTSLRPFTALILLHVALLGAAVGLLYRNKHYAAVDKEKIAVLSISGVIDNESGALDRGVSVDSIVDAIEDYRDDDDVKALVLQIDSPGGSVGSVQEIYSALKKFRAKNKFIVAAFADVAASGGYYIACAGDRIVSQPGTLTGSIGVIMQMPNVQGLLNKVGVSMATIKSGAMKDSGSPFRPMTDAEKNHFSSVIMDAYDQFYTVVKDGRKLTDDQLKPLADGRVFSGRMALNNKLVDQLGDLEDAIDVAKKLAGLEQKNPDVFYHHERPSLDRLLELLSVSHFKGLSALTSRQKVKLQYLLD
jgi:protease-4